MKPLERWQMGNPMDILERKEAAFDKRVRNATISDEDSRKIEDLIMVWYRWCMAYRPKLEAPQVSVYAKHAESSDVYTDSEEIDARIAAEKAEIMDCCIDSLPWKHRNAVDIHACNKKAKAQVVRNPRISREEHHLLYVEAKSYLLPLLRNRGLL